MRTLAAGAIDIIVLSQSIPIQRNQRLGLPIAVQRLGVSGSYAGTCQVDTTLAANRPASAGQADKRRMWSVPAVTIPRGNMYTNHLTG